MAKVVLGQLAMVGICSISSIAIAGKLPAQVPTHWGLNGQADAWGSPAFALWFGPLMTAFMLGFTFVMPSLPGGKNAMRSGDAYGNTLILVSGMMTFVHFAILRATAAGSLPGAGNGPSELTSTLFGGIFLFLAALGSQMKNLKPNPYMGIRTPWTLSSERVWKESHRRGGMMFVVGGLVGAAICFLGGSVALAVPVLVAVCILPLVDSFLLSKRLV